MTWLKSLGRVLTDYNLLTMEVFYHNQPITLYAEKLLQDFPLKSISVQKLIEHDNIVSVCQLNILDNEQSQNWHTIPANIRQFLQQYTIVFSEPEGLPTACAIDYHIELQHDSKPVNVRPYKYPYFQKVEIERLVSEMLKSGIIGDNTSSFSSPVLLIKKKDESWGFCVDYCALNAIIIRVFFPMPTMEEILDELHGATIFSKFDLCSSYHQIRMHEDDIYKIAFRIHMVSMNS